MKTYNIPEAIAFLAKEYGEENMPTSEETLRRAIRTKKIAVHEEGDPGRKGYTISEKDLREYAENRLKRAQARGSVTTKTSKSAIRYTDVPLEDPAYFPDLYGQYIDGEISPSMYYRKLYDEKMKWEKLMYEKQEQLARLMAQCKVIENDIQSCQSSINAFMDGIAKFNP